MFKLQEDERMVREIRRHWFVMLFPLLSAGLLLLLPLVVAAILILAAPAVAPELHVGTDWSALTLLGLYAYLILVLGVTVFLAVQWTEYYLDVWYITNQRLVDVDQRSIFSRSVKSLRFERIQDVTVEVHGIIATLLKFGDIHVQTAGVAQEIIIHQAQRPYEARTAILEVHDKVTRRMAYDTPSDSL